MRSGRARNRSGCNGRNLEKALRSDRSIASNIGWRSDDRKGGRDSERFPSIRPKQIPESKSRFVEANVIEFIHEIPTRYRISIACARNGPLAVCRIL
jgi:hypothetical protein